MNPAVQFIDWAFVLFAIRRLHHVFHAWHQSWSYVQSYHLSDLLRVIVQSRSGIHSLAFAVISFSTPVIVHLMQWYDRIGLIVAGPLLGLSILLILFQPPVILVLGSSDPIARNLVCAVNSAFVPLRVVGLFDRERMKINLWKPELISRDNLRTYDESTWKLNVKRLSDTVGMIVVDARISSPPVVYEIGLICNCQRYRNKAIFVCTTTGSAPALEAAGICLGTSEYQLINCLPDDQLLAAMLSLTLMQSRE